MGKYSHNHKYHWKKYKVDARNDKLTTDEDAPLTFTAAALLGNDKGRDLEIDSVTQPRHGTLTLNANGTYTYTPNPDFAGTDYFRYKVVNEKGKTDWAKVKICVNEMPEEENQNPIGGNDKFHVKEHKKFAGNVAGNDSDPDNDAITFRLVEGPENYKKFEFDTATGDFVFKAKKDRDFKDDREEFTYVVVDEHGAESGPVTVTLCIDDTWGKKKYYDDDHGKKKYYDHGDMMM